MCYKSVSYTHLIINKFRGGTAAVFIEPIGPESATRPVDKDFPKGVQALCRKYGALLVCDEVVSGFRIGLSGAQGYYGIDPDITIFGKVIAGGYPGAGGIGGHKEVMKYLDVYKRQVPIGSVRIMLIML